MKALLIKELRGYLRGTRPFTMLTIYLVILSVPLLLFYASAVDNPFTDFSEVGLILFGVVNGIALAQLTLLVPTSAAGTIGGERERQTLDLLLVTPLSSWRIILAKLSAPVLFLSLLAFATLPITALAFFIGGITLTDLILSLVIMITAAIGYGSIGIMSSVLARTSRGAAIVAVGLTALCAVGAPLLLLLLTAMLEFRGGPAFEGLMVPVALVLMTLSPFVALIEMISRIERGGPIWTTSLDGAFAFEVPAIWLSSLILWLALSFLMLAWSTRRLRSLGGAQ